MIVWKKGFKAAAYQTKAASPTNLSHAQKTQNPGSRCVLEVTLTSENRYYTVNFVHKTDIHLTFA